MDVQDGVLTHCSQGKYLDSGSSGIIELLPNGLVLKSPWPGEQEQECQEDIKLEAHAYQRLTQRFGAHKRLTKFIEYDEVQHTITMEYVAHGSLRKYLKAYGGHISQAQRYAWILEMADGMDLLHSANIVHCDFGPQNLLLDQNLEIKVADFACCSMDGAPSLAGGATRYYPPRSSWRAPLTVQHDLFALGSCIYEVLTNQAPFQDIPSPCVQNLYRLKQFPDLTGLDLGDVIRDCWLFRAQSANYIYRRVQAAIPTRV